MWAWLNQIDPLWFSVGPLLLINVFALGTVVIFAFIRNKNPPIPALSELENRHHSRFLNKWFKEYWFWITSPVEKIALKFNLTPNFFTIMGFVLSALAGLAFYYGRLGIAGWLMILGGSCDIFDGRVARLTGKSSSEGAFFDSVMDRYGELAALFGIAIFYRETWVFYFVLAAIIGSMMVSYNRARGQAVGVDCSGGLMQRPERIVYLGVGSIFSPVLASLLKPIMSLPLEFLLTLAVILIAILTNLTALYRLAWVYRRLKEKGQAPKVEEKKTKPAFVLRETHPRGPA